MEGFVMKEALKLALEALERSVATCFDQYAHQQVMSQSDHFINQAITALRLAIDVQNMASESTYKAALAQPAQQELVEVSSFEFVTRVIGKEDVIGKPMFWAKWPSKEKNT